MFRKFFRVNQKCESVVCPVLVNSVAGVLGVFRWFFMGGLGQCVANVWILEYIRILIDEYIHLSNYWLDFRATNVFRHLFV